MNLIINDGTLHARPKLSLYSFTNCYHLRLMIPNIANKQIQCFYLRRTNKDCILWEYSCEIIQQQGYKTWCQSTNTHTFKKTKNIHSQLLFSAVNKIVVFLSPLSHDAVMTHQANITVVEKYDITVVWILHCLTYILRTMLFIKAKIVSKRW